MSDLSHYRHPDEAPRAMPPVDTLDGDEASRQTDGLHPAFGCAWVFVMFVGAWATAAHPSVVAAGIDQLGIYGIAAWLAFAVPAAVVGYRDLRKDGKHGRLGSAVMAGVLSLIWPVAITGILVMGLYALAMGLGWPSALVALIEMIFAVVSAIGSVLAGLV